MSVEASADDRAKRMHALLDQCDDPVLALDLHGRIVFANRGAARAAGAPAAALLGRRIADAGLFGADGPRADACLRQALHDGGSSGCELHCERGAEAARTYELRVDVDRDDAGAVRGLLVHAHDVSQRRRIENDLRHREREFRTLAENSPDAIIRYGLDLRAVYCNREIEERVAVSAMRVVGRTPAEAAPPGMGGVAAYEAQLGRTLATGERGTVELMVPHPNGEIRVHSVAFEPERDAAGTIRGALAVGRDVTEQVRIRQALAAKEREFRSLAENAGDNIVRWTTDGRMVYLNPAMLRVVGVPAEHLLGRSSLEAFPDRRFATVHEAVMRVAREGSPALVELRFAPGDGARAQVHQIRLVPEPDEHGRVCGVLGIGRDITEKIEQLELIESLVRTDALTGLGNRRALEERALALLAASARHGHGLAVMLLDLDEFKSINDALGHGAGDRLLCEVARRLSASLRANDLLVRLGGDEFVVLVPDVDGARGVAAVAAKLHAALVAPFAIGDREVSVSASLGVALHPNDGEGLEPLLAHADSAMYQAKRSGRGGTAYYRRELSAAVQRRLVLEASMRAACEGDGLVLHFQPQVCLQRREVVGAEALLRWQHPTLGLLAPDAFIPLAEETGMIAPIGRWVLETAARAVVGWNRGRATPLTVSVNVSTRQFALDRLPCLIDEVLARTGCAPGWLALEITESALLEDSPLVQRTLEAFRARGVRVALDDFGTGYSALNYLARFYVDCLKIDKSFVQAIGRSERDGELVKAFIAMADALKLTTLAEGIETEAQAAFLVANGCRLAQGFLFGRPMPQAEFERAVAGVPVEG